MHGRHKVFHDWLETDAKEPGEPFAKKLLHTNGNHYKILVTCIYFTRIVYKIGPKQINKTTQ